MRGREWKDGADEAALRVDDEEEESKFDTRDEKPLDLCFDFSLRTEPTR